MGAITWPLRSSSHQQLINSGTKGWKSQLGLKSVLRFGRSSLPAEVEERPAGLRDVLVEPSQEMELGDSPGLVGLHVLQVEAADQEVVTPDVFRHQVDLQVHTDAQLPP